MKARIFFLPFAIIGLFCGSPVDSNERPENLSIISNSSFEDSLNYWNTTGVFIRLSEDTAFTGKHSVFVNTRTRDIAYAYQFLTKPVVQLESNFRVFPASSDFQQAIQFLAKWDPDSSSDIIWIIQVEMSSESIQCKSLDSILILPSTLKFYVWNTLSIQTYSTGEINVYINDTLRCSFMNEDLIPIESLMFGDLTVRREYGAVYYDDFTVQTKE
jgi:hypothetical protein